MSTLEEKIAIWLKDQGYPLEMRVAREFRSIGVCPDHHRVYEDPATGKTREIDIVGYLDNRNLSVHLVVECKHSMEKPWVLFCTSNHVRTRRGYVLSVPCTPEAEKVLEDIADLPSVQQMAMFLRPTLVGFRLIRAHTDNQDAAFHVVAGLSAACAATADAIGRHGHRVLYVPTVVVDSPLLQCHLPDTADSLDIVQVPRGLLLHSLGDARFAAIHVVHIDSLAGFIAELQRDSSCLAATVAAKSMEPDPTR